MSKGRFFLIGFLVYFAFLVALGLLVVRCAHADEKPADPKDVGAIMFYVTIDKTDGHYTHAQVVGGYKDHDDCIHAIPIVGAATAPDLAPTDIPVFLCPVVDVEGILKKQAEPEAPHDPTPLKDRARTPISDT